MTTQKKVPNFDRNVSHTYNSCRLYKSENTASGSPSISLSLISLEEAKELVNNKVACSVFTVIVNNKGVRFTSVD